MHNKIARLELVRVNLLGARAAALADIAGGCEGVLAKKLAIAQHQGLGQGQDKAFELSQTGIFEGHGGTAVLQSRDRGGIFGVGDKLRRTIMLLQQRHGARGLRR